MLRCRNQIESVYHKSIGDCVVESVDLMSCPKPDRVWCMRKLQSKDL